MDPVALRAPQSEERDPSPLDGYDPLDEHLDSSSAHLTLIQDSTRRIVQNILKSYTGYFDVFNEAIQNALDAVDAKSRQGQLGYNPKVHISIDIPRRVVRISDNGTGMDQEQFRLCFRPNTSFKNRRESRGSKGVGATFLAYGFSMITLQSKKGENRTAAVLRGGRDWAEERTTIRPRLSVVEFDAPELLHETSGTSVEILIAESQRPRLGWLGAKTAESWYEVLRIRSPLGGVHITKGEKETIVEPEVHVRVVSVDGTLTEIIRSRSEYYYPHEMPIFDATKVKTIGNIVEMESLLPGNVKAKAAKIPESYRRLEAIWEIWDETDLVTHPVLSREQKNRRRSCSNTERKCMASLLARLVCGQISNHAF